VGRGDGQSWLGAIFQKLAPACSQPARIVCPRPRPSQVRAFPLVAFPPDCSQIARDSSRTKYLEPDEALTYGIVDTVGLELEMDLEQTRGRVEGGLEGQAKGREE
jgi:hypothetical protein